MFVNQILKNNSILKKIFYYLFGNDLRIVSQAYLDDDQGSFELTDCNISLYKLEKKFSKIIFDRNNLKKMIKIAYNETDKNIKYILETIDIFKNINMSGKSTKEIEKNK